jgi:hypothetical protein
MQTSTWHSGEGHVKPLDVARAGPAFMEILVEAYAAESAVRLAMIVPIFINQII